MPGIVLDSGALIQFERGDRVVIALIEATSRRHDPIIVPAGVLAQVWRDGRKQTRLARLLAKPEVAVEPLDDLRARATGQLCGVTRTRDVVDASVVLCARARGHRIVTSDPDDLARLHPTAELIVI
jgi:hypothetical protein